jgi:outer membrane biosynthesis protein TonB
MNTNTILLGVIALLLLVQTIQKLAGKSSGSSNNTEVIATNPVVNPQAPNVSPVNPNPVTPQPTAANTVASYAETEKDFGSVTMGSKHQHKFKVTNTGTNPLTYGQVTGDAGLTIVSYPTTSLAPGQSGEIVVEYTPDAAGAQTKQVHINANTEPSHNHLAIKANVK